MLTSGHVSILRARTPRAVKLTSNGAGAQVADESDLGSSAGTHALILNATALRTATVKS